MAALEVSSQVDPLRVPLPTHVTGEQGVRPDMINPHVLPPGMDRLTNVATIGVRTRNGLVLVRLKMAGERRVCLKPLLADEAAMRSTLRVSVNYMLP